MAAATLAGSRSVTTLGQGGAGAAYDVKAAWGTITVDSSTEDGDIWQICRVPAGSLVIGGWVLAGIGDSGIQTLDIDIGWAANGVDAVDPDGFGNLGVWTGDLGEGGSIEPGNHFLLGGVLISAGPKLFTVETLIQAETNTVAATGVAMELTVVVLYLYNSTVTIPIPPV